MIDLTNAQVPLCTTWPYQEWNNMLVEADKSNETLNNQYICRVIYPDGKQTLELKTEKQIQEHFKEYGSWAANCGKIRFHEILNITRITYVNNQLVGRNEDITEVKEVINHMAAKAESKYQAGFKGFLRKIMTCFLNLFASDDVILFNERSKLSIFNSDDRRKLPFIIGHNASFARLIFK